MIKKDTIIGWAVLIGLIAGTYKLGKAVGTVEGEHKAYEDCRSAILMATKAVRHAEECVGKVTEEA